jgi:hypothetical protein
MIFVMTVSTYLVSQLLVCFGILFWPNLLFEESKQDGDHQARLQRLTENNEEDWDGKDVGHPDPQPTVQNGLQNGECSNRLW